MTDIIPKMLCVDDEPSILQALERLLKSRFQVLTATSPVEGLERLREHPDCAIVLSDFRMPEGNGVDFLRQVRVLYPETSRAILSGQIDLHQVSMALNTSDIHKFFLKPWENEYLLLQMIEALQVHRALQEKAHFERLSITDPVTQLTNHRFFQDRLRQALEKARTEHTCLSLLMIDVDHFKSFNDRFGHPEGDRLLFSLADQIKREVGERGVVSRYGGEEFTVVLPDLNLNDAQAIGNALRTRIEKTPIAGLMSSQAYVTISGGIACFPDHANKAGDLIETADRALYQAKRQGRNQVVCASNR